MTDNQKEIHKKARAKYQKKCINKSIQFAATEIEFYNRIMKYCELNKEPFSTYIKRLIKDDLEKNNV